MHIILIYNTIYKYIYVCIYFKCYVTTEDDRTTYSSESQGRNDRVIKTGFLCLLYTKVVYITQSALHLCNHETEFWPMQCGINNEVMFRFGL